MGLFRTLLLGAAAYGAYKYATKKDANGRSMVDDIKDKAPEWKEKIMRFKDDVGRDFKHKAKQYE
ncbi:YtxH domain-containing protein [Olivibacter sp. XZL3]|uniref:YtxH domain-containing protein n=1 Tax=Olivibacter sp. XZL3 TaxID=1735116 RepID=UPI001065E90E|nr:YtxH domain-containing protein [Olivibacter sp. XZL3]